MDDIVLNFAKIELWTADNWLIRKNLRTEDEVGLRKMSLKKQVYIKNLDTDF